MDALSWRIDLAWLKFIIVGLLLEVSRRVGIIQGLCDKALDLISVRATFGQGDYSYRQLSSVPFGTFLSF
jgi:hypothetical protein